MRGRGALRRVDRREGPGVEGSGVAVAAGAAVAVADVAVAVEVDAWVGRRSHLALASFAALGYNSIEQF